MSERFQELLSQAESYSLSGLSKLDQDAECAIQNLEAAVALWEEACTFAELPLESLRRYAKVLDCRGNIARKSGQWHQAQRYFEELLRRVEQIRCIAGDTPATLRDTCWSLGRLGSVAWMLRQFNVARLRYEASLDLAEQIRARFGNHPKTLRLVSVNLGCLGDVFRALGQLDEARQRYKAKLELAQKICTRGGNTLEELRDWHASILEVGDVARLLGRLEEARLQYEAALRLARQIRFRNFDSAIVLRDESLSHRRMGVVEGTQGHFDKARQHFEATLVLVEQIRGKFGDTLQALQDVNICHGAIGDVNFAQGEFFHALQHYREKLALARQIQGRCGDRPHVLRNICMSQVRLGNVASKLDQLEDARQHYETALELGEQIRSLTGDTSRSLRDLSVIHSNLGDLAIKNGGLNLAAHHGLATADLSLKAVVQGKERVLKDFRYQSRQLVGLVHVNALQSPQVWPLYDRMLLTVKSYPEFNDPESIERARVSINQFHSIWLALAIDRCPERIPGVLGASQGRKVTMLAMDEMHRQAHSAEAASIPEFLTFLECRKRVNDLSLALGGGANASSLFGSMAGMPGKMDMGGMQAGESAEAIRNRTEYLWTEYRNAVKAYEAARDALIAIRPELADIAPAPADRYRLESLQRGLKPGNALLLLAQSPKDSEHPGQAYALLIKANGEGEQEPVLRALPGLQTLPSQLRAYRQTMTGGHRAGGAWRDCEGLTRASEAKPAGSEAESLVQAIEPEQGMRERLWEVLQGQNGQADLLKGIEHLHIVSHGELHNLPLALGAPEGLGISQYPGLVYYWMVHNRKDQQTLTLNALDRLRMQVYSPEVDLAKGETTSLSPIPHVQTEAELVGSCWAKRDELLQTSSVPDQPATVLHLACHGTEREGQEDPCLILSPKSKLNLIELLQGAPSAPIVYLSACLVGQTHEDLDGDPLGLVGGFMVRGAQCVIAALNPINDFWAPLLAYLFNRTLQAQAQYNGQLDPVGALADAKRQIQEGSWVAQCVPEAEQAQWEKEAEEKVVKAYGVRLQKQLEDALTLASCRADPRNFAQMDNDCLVDAKKWWQFISDFLDRDQLSAVIEEPDERVAEIKACLEQKRVQPGASAASSSPQKEYEAGELLACAVVRSKKELHHNLPAVQALLRDLQAFGVGLT